MIPTYEHAGFEHVGIVYNSFSGTITIDPARLCWECLTTLMRDIQRGSVRSHARPCCTVRALKDTHQDGVHIENPTAGEMYAEVRAWDKKDKKEKARIYALAVKAATAEEARLQVLESAPSTRAATSAATSTSAASSSAASTSAPQELSVSSLPSSAPVLHSYSRRVCGR